ncbi:hypothetical protein [Parvibaculum sp.]|uniref:hypothetical protein n=1 Tax=Parvibaculum sp. TaxID=2024848 RepID=UPI000C8A61AA|nr:hypothetical protein [Parvibaculum sp.]MAB15023.1 hypothetical protein [Parvibaculum sp.]
MRLNKTGFLSRIALTVLTTAGLWSAPAAADSIGEAIDNGKPFINLRMRYEHVDQDGFANDADALTGRARLGYETGSFYGFSLLADFDLITHFGAEDFNSTVNGRTTYPVVADPDMGQVNRAQISYTGLPETTVVVGRQRMILDNARFVGNVGWRQNEQTFDAARVTNKSLPGTTIDYAYVRRVNRIFGAGSSAGEFQGDTHLVNLGYTGLGFADLTGYAYLVDLNEAPALSTATYGLRATAPFHLTDKASLKLTGEYAHQTDYADNPLSLDVDYYLGEAMLAYGPASLTGGYEVLGSDGTSGFSTPLATLHAFNGWADVFLTTPGKGLEDAYAKASYALTGLPIGRKLVLGVAYHDFSANEGGVDLGNEFDAVANLVLTDSLSLNLKFASYDGDGGYASRDKSWVTLTYAY